MEAKQAGEHLERCLKTVFDSVPKGKRPLILDAMMYVETLAKCGVEEYARLCNKTVSEEESAAPDTVRCGLCNQKVRAEDAEDCDHGIFKCKQCGGNPAAERTV